MCSCVEFDMKRVSVVIDWISYPKSCCLLAAGFFLKTFSIICTIVCSPPPCFSNLFNDPTPNFLLPTDTNILTFVIDGVLSHKTWKFKHLKFWTVFLAKDFSLCTRDEGRRRSITTILLICTTILWLSASSFFFSPRQNSYSVCAWASIDTDSCSRSLLSLSRPFEISSTGFWKTNNKSLWETSFVNFNLCFSNPSKLRAVLPLTSSPKCWSRGKYLLLNFKISKFHLLWEKKFDEKIYLLGWLLVARIKIQIQQSLT